MTDLMVSLGEYFRSPQSYPKINKAIGFGAAGAEAVMNPSSVFRTLSRSAKSDVSRALGSIMKGSRTTSAINMAYGKRRNSRSKRSYGRRSSSRKRVYGRRRRVGKKSSGSSTLAVLKKALSGQMGY